MSDPISSRLEFMEFNAGQKEALRSVRPLVRAVIGPALDRFYARIRRTPETNRFFRDSAHVGQAKAAQERHWDHLASADFDARYFEGTRRIGATHARIGLEPRWYIGGYALLIEELLRGVTRRMPLGRRILALFRPDTANEAAIALTKAALLDMELSLSVYFEEAQASRNVAAAQLDRALAALAEGDLSQPLSGMPESFATIERSYNDALARIAKMIGNVAEGAGRIRTGVGEIAQASEDLARRTQSNAASLEQTTAAVGQMDGRLKTSAGAARNTVARADKAIATIGGGRSTADHAMQSMQRVSESAKGIDTVIEGVDKIAFQTRVLAMNAAVEAGRAGEAGRGFAVVADLVSALAMRAEEEAKRAREQLTATQGEIVNAVDAVRQVDDALAGISEDVGQVHLLLGQMAEDNGAQAIAIGEISSAIGTMDRSTQQNAAMVEQTSASARNLTLEVEALAEMTEAFRLQGSTAPAGPAGQLSAAAVAALTRPQRLH